MAALLKVVAAACALAAVSQLAAGAERCLPGRNGSGGVYDESKLHCVEGRLLSLGTEWCPAGPNGPGGAYVAGKAHCDGGRPLPDGVWWCRQPNGQGGPYGEGEARCVGGKLIAISKDSCPAGPNGPGGTYDKKANQRCVGGKVLSSWQSWCPAGPDGRGGAYEMAHARCAGGRVVPK